MAFTTGIGMLCHSVAVIDLTAFMSAIVISSAGPPELIFCFLWPGDRLLLKSFLIFKLTSSLVGEADSVLIGLTD